MELDLEINETFIEPLFQDTSRFKVFKGGGGSGKSVSIIQFYLSYIITNPKYNILVVRKVAATIKQSVFAEFVKWIFILNLEKYFKINNSDFVIECFNKNVIVFKGMDKPEKIKSITTINGIIESVFAEEATELEKADYTQLNIRLRGKSAYKKTFILAFNPITDDHWLKAEFFDRDKPNSMTHESTYLDNVFLDDDIIAEYEEFKETDPYHYQVYARGEWGSIDESDTVIPYRLIHLARKNKIADPVGMFEIGCDPARFGDDEAVIYWRRGLKTLGKKVYKKSDGFMLADFICELIVENQEDTTTEINGIKITEKEEVKVKVDVTGVGSSTADVLRKKAMKNVKVYEVNNGGSAKNKNKYSNTVTESYYELRHIITEIEVLENDSKMFGELSKRKYQIDFKTSRYKLEPKDAFKKRIKKSPDSADAFVLCFYTPPSSTIQAAGSSDLDYNYLEDFETNQINYDGF